MAVVNDEHYIEVADGITYYLVERYQDTREPKTTVLLLHGATDGHITWDISIKDYSVMDFLVERKFRVFAPDFRCYGKSTKPSGLESRSEIIAGDLEKVIAFVKNRAEIDSISVAGHMFGSILGAMCAVKYPESVKKLVMRSPSYQKIGEHARNNLQPMVLKLIKDGVDYMPNRGETKIMAGNLISADEEVIDWFIKRKMEHTPKNPIGHAIDMEEIEGGGLPFDHYIPQVEVPTMVIAAEHDEIAPLEQAKNLYEDLGSRDKTFVEIKNSSHGVILEREAHIPAMEAIYEWLKD